jgi:Ca2+-binding EF-hand superfamily protein
MAHLHHLRRAFDYVDKDRDGSISHAELAAVFVLVGQPKSASEVDALLRAADMDGSSTTSFEEFVAMLKHEQHATLDHELSVYFEAFDTGKTGQLTAERVKAVLDALGEPTTLREAELMMHYADANGDGVVSLDDFVERFKHLAKSIDDGSKV